jgi:hypothetical protein
MNTRDEHSDNILAHQESTAIMEEGSSQSSPLTPAALARRLLAPGAERSDSSESLIAQAAYTFVQLRTLLAVFLGFKGFDSLWARAMLLARQKLQAEGLEGELALVTPPEQWVAAASSLTADEAHTSLQAQFASFISLLFTFVGEELGLRLLHPILRETSPHEEDRPTEDTHS